MEQQDIYSAYRKELKERILVTSMQAFKQRGIRSVRMDDIATKLGISKRTIYELYANKEELLLDGIMREDRERKRDSQLFAQDESHTVMDIIFHVYNREMADMATINPLFFSELTKYSRVIKYLTNKTEKDHQEALDFIKRGIDEGYFVTSFDYNVVLNFISFSSKLVMGEQMFQAYDANYLFTNVAVLFLRGFCTAKGVDFIDNVLLKDTCCSKQSSK